MSRKMMARKAATPGPVDEGTLDEACFAAELRLFVEGARTASEERLARRDKDWTGRFGRVSKRVAG